MGRCCKCGRETAHAYRYWTGDLLGSKRAKTCTNVQEHAAFLCTRCAMGYYTLCWALGSAAYSACFAITAGRYYTAAIFGIISAGWLAVFVHALIVMRRDKALPFYVGNVVAEKRLIKIMRKQNPGTNYFAPSDYH